MRQNETERTFEEFASANGWQPSKRGWPDFRCKLDNQFVAVEVKPRTKSGRVKMLSREQVEVMDFLIAHGISCFVSDGCTLEPYDRKIHAPEERRRQNMAQVKERAALRSPNRKPRVPRAPRG